MRIILRYIFILLILAPSMLKSQVTYTGADLVGFDEVAVQKQIDHMKSHGVPASELENIMESRKMAYVIKKRGLSIPVGSANKTTAAGCNNGDFELGNFTGWDAATGCAPKAYAYKASYAGMCSGDSLECCFTPGFVAGSQTIVSGAGTDPFGGFPVVAPGGNYSVMLGNTMVAGHSDQLSQTFTVTAASTAFVYNYAVVLQDPGHSADEQPFFKIEMFTQNGTEIPCAYYFVAAGQGIPGFAISPASASVIYKPWTKVIIDLTTYVGQTVTIKFTTADCARGGHYGYAYIDTYCEPYAVTQTIPFCSGSSTSLVAPAGAASYSWTGPNGFTATTQTANATTAGNYSVELVSVQGCRTILNYTLQPVTPTAAFSATTVCKGNATTFTNSSSPSAGTSITGWSWNFGNGSTSTLQHPTHTYASSGTYTATLTVTSSDNCPASVSKTITVNSLPTIALTATHVTCNGLGNGSISSSITTATMPYTYSWSTTPLQITANATGLTPSTYTVKVTDGNGCSSTATAAITQPVVLTSSTNETAISCYNGADGTATITGSGGTVPYTYSWSTNPVKTTATASGLNEGTYTAMVTDAKGCTSSATVTLTQPTQLVSFISDYTNVTCKNLGNGTATVTASGGTSPYQYSWSTLPSQNTAKATGLAPGSYTVKVTDSKGCTVSSATTITEPQLLTVSTSAQPVACNGGSTGSANVSANGGTASYGYSWSNGQTLSSSTGLIAGTYTIIVTDQYNCTASATAVVSQPTSLTLSATAIDVTCYNGTNASITATPAGGNSSYIYSWSYSPAQTASSATSLSAGGYTIVVTDSKNCTASATVAVTQPNAILTFITGSTPVSCYAGNDGTATAQAGGGTPPLTYAWNTTPIQTSLAAANLPAGGYTLTVTDANGCTGTTSTNITQPTLLKLTTGDVVNVNCKGGNDGSAFIGASGGVKPYAYSWNTTPVQTTNSIDGMTAGTYSITVTDANGCTTTNSVLITEPPLLTLVLSAKQDIPCYGMNTGSATFTAGGGVPSYSYSWNTNPVITTTSGNDLKAGNYVVVLKDAKGCTSSASVTLTQPDSLAFQVCSTCTKNVSCYGGNDGSAKVISSGATMPHSYSWSTSPVQTTTTASGLQQGTYTVWVIDGNGCKRTKTVTISEPPVLKASTQVINVSCKGKGDGLGIAVGSGGTVPYTYQWSGNDISSMTTNASGLIPGDYEILITDAKGCASASKMKITEPEVLTTNINNVVNVSCYGLNNGFASIAGTGGTGIYSYSWTTVPAQTTLSATGLGVGSYTATVTDTKGCISSSSLTITQPMRMTASAVQQPVACYDGKDGSITIGAGGGVAPYTYSWSHDAQLKNNSASGLSKGVYSVRITDALGCVYMLNHTLTQPAPVGLTVSGEDTVCSGTQVVISATASGGIGTYNYSWNNGLPDAPRHTITPVATTNYIVQARDSKGCPSLPKTIPVVVPQPGMVDIAINSPGAICEGASAKLSAQLSSSATKSGTITWSENLGTGAGPFVVSPKATTIYTVTVTDNCNNTTTKTTMLRVNKTPVISIPPKTATGCDGVKFVFADSSLTNQGSSYVWNFGDGNTSTETNPVYSYTRSGTFNITVKVKSPEGCEGNTSTTYITIINPSPVADFNADPPSASIYKPTLRFINTSLNATSAVWDFGDGTTSTDMHATHTYKNKGTYNVRLRVYNLTVCEDEIVKPVEVMPEFQFYVPNAFTPDGDGKNEIFNGKGEEIITYHMEIFDRWGEMVFESNDYNKGWDGRANGGTEIAQQDVYVYKIKLTDFRGDVHDYIGHVSLLK